MFDKDKSSWGGSSKKEKKVKAAPKKSESKKLFGGASFGGNSFGSDSFGKSSSFGIETNKKTIFDKFKGEKAESFGDEKEKKSLFGKSKESSFGSDNEKSPKRLKWWQILLIVLGSLIITAAIIAGALIAQVKDYISGNGDGGFVGDIIDGIIGGGGDTGGDVPPATEGIISSYGTFIPKGTAEYIFCEYTEYFSGKTVQLIQKPEDIRHDYKPYWVFISDNGTPLYNFSGPFSGNSTPEEVKQELFSQMSVFGYTEERLANCAMHLYQPVSFTRVVISSATIAEDGNVSIKYSAGAVDGEMSEEYELIGTYIKTEGDFAFSYTNLPEDENLLCVAETLLSSAKYDYYAKYGQWVNKLTFGDYALYLTEDDSVGDDTTDDDVVNDDTTDDGTTDDDVVNDGTTDDDVVNDDTTDDDVVNDDNVNDDSLDDDTVNDDSSNDDSSDNTL